MEENEKKSQTESIDMNIIIFGKKSRRIRAQLP